MEQKNILVVDDDKDIAYGVSAWLEIKKFKTSIARDGAEALEAALLRAIELILAEDARAHGHMN